jgi:hypothetical protein
VKLVLAFGLAMIFGATAARPAAADWVDKSGIWHASSGKSAAAPKTRDAGAATKRTEVAFTSPARKAKVRRLKHIPAPKEQVVRLRPPPVGTYYIRAHNNIYLVDRRSRRILDGIRIF